MCTLPWGRWRRSTLGCRCCRGVESSESSAPCRRSSRGFACTGYLQKCTAINKRLTIHISRNRARIFKLLGRPGIDYKGLIPQVYVAWRAGTIILFLLYFLFLSLILFPLFSIWFLDTYVTTTQQLLSSSIISFSDFNHAINCHFFVYSFFYLFLRTLGSWWSSFFPESDLWRWRCSPPPLFPLGILPINCHFCLRNLTCDVFYGLSLAFYSFNCILVYR